MIALLAASLLLLLAGAVASLVCARRRRVAGALAAGFVLASALPVAVLVVRTFARGAEPEVTLLELPALGARLAVAVDPLSALFLALAAGIAVLATLYSVDYMTQFRDDGVAKFYPVLLVFFGAVYAVLVLRDLLFFLVAWELMTLSSFFLVAFESRSREAQRAALKYFVMTHAGTLCLVAGGLLLWRQAGSFQFAALGEALGRLLVERPVTGHVAVLLLFLGFATKAGLLPMGDWLPDAHPAAPSGVSAALSGLLVKLGVYGLFVTFGALVPVSSGAAGWGTFLALCGTASLFVATILSLNQRDAKRLLAFSTIAQIGYVVLALGVGVAVLGERPALGALALMAGLLHVVNHACFKACLFFGIGSVLHRTGERDLERLGGLAASLPVTAATSTVASLAIVGVPPLNGFASKWLIVATCLLAGMGRPVFLAFGLVALFVSLVTLAAFAKLLGTVFLGPPTERKDVSEAPATMLVPQVVLATLCVVLGVLPGPALRLAHQAVAGLLPVALPSFEAMLQDTWRAGVRLDGAVVASWGPPVVLVGLALGTALAWALQRAAGVERREVPVWSCGEEHTARELRYRASSFYVPLRSAFAGVYPSPRWHWPAFPPALRRAMDLDARLYLPLTRLTERAARAVSRTHVGVPQVYLLWILVGAIVTVTILLAVR
jgi:hydrogenase-4 component B